MRKRSSWMIKGLCLSLALALLSLMLILGWQRPLEALAQSSGFVLHEIRIYDRSRSDKQELLETIGLRIGMSLAAISPKELRKRLLELRWVADARVQRYWSGLLVIALREHNPAALWQHGENLVPISRDGTPIITDGFTPFEKLFRISGEEAPAHLEELLQIVAHWPELHGHISQAHLTTQNTWNLTLHTGTKVLLASDPLLRNVLQLLRLERHYGILEAPPLVIDLRASDRASVRAISEDAKALVMKMRNQP